MYSFGIVLWEMSTLKKPFEGMGRDQFFSQVTIVYGPAGGGEGGMFYSQPVPRLSTNPASPLHGGVGRLLKVHQSSGDSISPFDDQIDF